MSCDWLHNFNGGKAFNVPKTLEPGAGWLEKTDLFHLSGWPVRRQKTVSRLAGCRASCHQCSEGNGEEVTALRWTEAAVFAAVWLAFLFLVMG